MVWLALDEIAKLFPNMFGQPSAKAVPSASPKNTGPVKIGVVLSGGQAPGGHNVICGIFGVFFNLNLDFDLLFLFLSNF